MVENADGQHWSSSFYEQIRIEISNRQIKYNLTFQILFIIA